MPEPSNTGGRPPNWNKPAVKTSRKATPKARKPKPRVEPTPAELEARQEKRREYERQWAQTPEHKELMRRSTQERRDKAKLLGICVECGAPPIPDETRCQTCSNRHREYQKQARERAAQKREQASGQTHVRVGKPNVAKSWSPPLTANWWPVPSV